MPERFSDVEELIQQILEQQAYLFGDPVPPEDLPETLAEAIEVVVTFHGAHSGRIALGCPRELSREIAANVLGAGGPEEVDDEEAEDALKELMNVLTGRLLARLDADPGLVEITPPRLAADADGARWAALRGSSETCSFLVEDRPALFHVHLEEER